MRQGVAALVMVIGLPVAVAAQSVMPQLHVSPTLPPIGLPLPPIGLPLPPLGLAPVVEPQPPGIRQSFPRPDTRPSRPSRRFGRTVPAVIFVPSYGWGYYPEPYPPAMPGTTGSYAGAIPQEPGPPTGRLQLDVRAGAEAPQLYVDGFYVGTAEDLHGELDLEAGAHRVEIRASGYQTITLDVRIEAGRSISFRGALERSAVKPGSDAAVRPDAPDVTPQAVAPTTLYYIPGCYLGNIPPADVALPATCDMSRLVVHKP